MRPWRKLGPPYVGLAIFRIGSARNLSSCVCVSLKLSKVLNGASDIEHSWPLNIEPIFGRFFYPDLPLGRTGVLEYIPGIILRFSEVCRELAGRLALLRR
jgi:hypothetical protein